MKWKYSIKKNISLHYIFIWTAYNANYSMLYYNPILIAVVRLGVKCITPALLTYNDRKCVYVYIILHTGFLIAFCHFCSAGLKIECNFIYLRDPTLPLEYQHW